VEKEYEKNPSTFVDVWDADVFTTYGKNINFPWNDIFSEYEKNIEDLQKSLNICGQPMITQAWFNAYKINQNQEIHEHLPGQFAAIHYISYDENEHLPTIFINPYRQVVLSNSPKFNSNDNPDNIPPTWIGQSFIKIKEGDLLVFPAFLEHKVPRQLSDKLRVTLSFNLNFVSLPPE
jgi:hypothetical protein